MRGLAVVLSGIVGCIFSAGCQVRPAASPRKVAASPAGLLVRLSVVEGGTIDMKSEGPALHVVFENRSAAPLGVIDEWNSWGYFNVKLKYTMSDGIPRMMKREFGMWTRNFLTVTMLQPQEVLVRDIYLKDHGWEGVPTVTQDTPVTIQAVFTQDGSRSFEPGGNHKEEERRAGAWMGIAESVPVHATLKATL